MKNKYLPFVLLLVLFIVGYSIYYFSNKFKFNNTFPNNKKTNIVDINQEAFNFNYEYNDDYYDYYLNNDDFDSLIMGGPYYIGEKTIDNNYQKNYDELKFNIVNQSIENTNELIKNARLIDAKLDDYKGQFLFIMSNLSNIDNKYKEDLTYVLELFLKQNIKINSINSMIDSLNFNTQNKALKANNEYSKSSFAALFYNILVEDMITFISLSTELINSIENIENEEIKLMIEKYDQDMTNFDDIFVLKNEMSENLQIIGKSLEQLDTAEYYMSLHGLDFINKNIDDIKAKSELIKPSKIINQNDVDFINEYVDFFEDFSKSYKEILIQNNQDILIIPEQAYNGDSLFFNKIYANNQDGYLTRALGSLSYGTKKLIKGTSSAVDSLASWTKIKDVYKGTKKTLGIGLGALDSSVKSGFDIIRGKIEGNTNKEIGQAIMDNFKKFDESMKNGTQGAQVLKTAEEYLDYIETTTGKVGEGVTEKIFGKGKISQGVGYIGKLSANLFTGLGKGIYKISNQTSTDGEIAEGMLDVGLSLIGGSKVIFKGSKLLGSGKNFISGISKKSLGYLGNLGNVLSSNSLKTLPKAISGNLSNLKIFISSTSSSSLKQMLKDNLTRISSNVLQSITDIAKEGRKVLKTKGMANAKSSFTDMVSTSYTKSLSGYVKSLKGVLGNGFGEYFDNVLGNQIDNMVKGYIREAIDKQDLDNEEENDEEENDEGENNEEENGEGENNEEENGEGENNEGENNEEENNQEENNEGENDIIIEDNENELSEIDGEINLEPGVYLIPIPDYPPGSETNTLDPQGLARYQVMKSSPIINLTQEQIKINHSISINADGAYKIIGNGLFELNGKFNLNTFQFEGSLLYKIEGIEYKSDGKENGIILSYEGNFFQVLSPDNSKIKISVPVMINSTKIIDGKSNSSEHEGGLTLLYELIIVQ